MPAYQRLSTDQRSVTVHLGLQKEPELLLPQALPQTVQQGGPSGDRGLHLQVEETQGIAAGRLGLEQGQIGLFQ